MSKFMADANQEFKGSILKIGPCEDAQVVHFFGGYFANAIELPDFKGQQKIFYFFRGDGFLSVGFIDVAGDLGQKFIDGDSR